jgi:hypothetical protein
MIKITADRLFFTRGIFPKKNPANVSRAVHDIPPMILNARNFEYFIFQIPATKGAKVLTIGTNLARIIVFVPYLS